MISRRRLAMFSAVIVSAALTGCDSMNIFNRDDKIKQLTAELETARAEAEAAKKSAFEARKQSAQDRKRVDTLVAIGPDRLKKLNYPVSIKLGQYTGGADFDGQPGHDGVKVFLLPIDAQGDTVKAAGSVTIKLHDLAQPEDQTLVGEYKLTVDQVAKAFAGGFGVYHYSFKCPWKQGPPKNSDLTVRVEFIDYITGKTLSVQKVCKVDPPAK